VTICPTVALYRRPDGIVDFDNRRCIGCKSCMQACPYDALYIDPDTNTAAKCHYCAHRIEVGLEPACVVVCPERAIIAGDLDDARTEIARLVAREQVEVRKPEQGTRPKVFYIGADSSSLTPALQRPAATYVFGQRPAAEVDLVRMVAALQETAPGTDGTLSRPVYDAPHAVRPWGWKVSSYLWTKSIAAGALMVAAWTARPGSIAADPFVGMAAPLLALLFLLVTTALLVLDLKRPDRFHYVLLRGNLRSWLTRGAWILMAYGAIGAWWLLVGLGYLHGPHHLLTLSALVVGAAAAGYSAFLFGQAEGRDFWQSPLLLPHLLIAAVVAGAAALTVAAAALGTDVRLAAAIWMTLGAGLVFHGILLFAELGVTHASIDVARAARLLTAGPLRASLWGGVVGLGVVAPVVLMVAGVPPVVSALLALAGLWLWEDLWVKAGQSVPLS
jgi:formate-dependent nitrite reductase membrane component NrfD/NAD-dependent dihydropyrimidine dehydrogenase PreA subunit